MSDDNGDREAAAKFGALGGRVRAERLSKEQRSAIASAGGQARWLSKLGVDKVANLPKAIASGILRIGGVPLACAVLDDADNTHVLTQDGFLVAIGRSKRPNTSDRRVLDGMPAFLRAINLKSFIDKNITCSTSPIIFHPHRGGGREGLAFGFEAELLPQVCWVYHDAAKAEALQPNQRHIAEHCDTLLRGLTNVAINALIDEVTGFQDFRARDALQKILDKYVSPEALPWVKMFDDEFYKLVFHLNGWPFDPMSVRRPSVIGHWTNDIYDRLPLHNPPARIAPEHRPAMMPIRRSSW
jgi:hypothetical protein